MAGNFNDFFFNMSSDNGNDGDREKILSIYGNDPTTRLERNVSPGSVFSTHTGTEFVHESNPYSSFHTFNTGLTQTFDSQTVPYFNDVEFALESESHLSLGTLDSDIGLGFDLPLCSNPDVGIALESDPPISLHTLNSELPQEFILPTYNHINDYEEIEPDFPSIDADMALDFDSHISQCELFPVSQTPETTENEIDSSPGDLQDKFMIEPQSCQTSSSDNGSGNGSGSRSSSESQPDTIVLHTPESHVLNESDIDASSNAPEIDPTNASKLKLNSSTPPVMTLPVDTIKDSVKEIHSNESETNDLTPNTKMENCVTPDFGESSKCVENKVARRKSRQSTSSSPQPKRLRPIRTVKPPLRFSEESFSSRKNNIYEVENILGKMLYDKQPLYLVKWMGYDESTWEPKKNLIRCNKMLKQFEKQLAQEKRLKRQQ